MASKLLYLSLWLIIALLHVLTQGTKDGLTTGLYFTQQPQDIIAIKAKPLWLNCSASVSPGLRPLNITWRKDGVVINDARRYVLRNGSLYFRRVIHRKQRGKSDEGYYECVARNKVGFIASRKAHLQVAKMSRFKEEPQSVTSIQGQVARFHCQLDAVPAPLFLWQRNRAPLPLNNDRFTVLSSGVLQITGVLPSDAGRYRCFAINVANKRRSKEAVLNVTTTGETKSLPIIVAGPARVITARVGEKKTLECLAIGAASITWTKQDGSAVVEGGRVRRLGQGNLEIQDISLSDTGIYTCTAYSNSGQTARAQGSLLVQSQPYLEESPENKIKPVGQPVRISCHFKGIPRPKITWYKNGQPVYLNGRIEIKNVYHLLISHSVSSDSGYYQCRGENPAGSAQATARLQIKASVYAPASPINLKAMTHSSTDIVLTWDMAPSRGNLPTVAYSVHYVSTAGGVEMQRVVDSRRVVLQNLRPYTNYTFYVVAYNKKSASEHSVKVTQITDEGMPIAAPAVKLSAIGSTSVKVLWNELPASKAQGVINRYKVFYRQEHKQYSKVEEMDGNSNEYIITGLESGKTFEVRVLAGTRIGFPTLTDKEWPWRKIQLMSHVKGAPGAPEIQVMPVNSTSLQVTWQQPSEPKVEVMGYKLLYQKLLGSKRSIELPASARRHTLTKLESGMAYEVSLLAFNNEGDGEMVSQSIIMPKNDSSQNKTLPPPPPPQDIEATPLNDTAIQAAWKQPILTEGIVSYTIRYYPVMSESDGQTPNSTLYKYIESDTDEMVLTMLKPYTTYALMVRTNTAESHGPFSSEVRCLTKEAKPSAPQNPHWTLQGPTTVEFNWQPPEHQNGEIVNYVILYKTNQDKKIHLQWTAKQEKGTVTTSLVEDLEKNTVYLFKLHAVNKAGQGAPTEVMTIQTRGTATSSVKPVSETTSMPQNPKLGIIIGVSIGIGCIIICIIILLLRNRCFPPRQAAREQTYLPHYNGNGNVPNYTRRSHNGGSGVRLSAESHELDSFQPMLTYLPENEHSDSKGMPVGGLNGLSVHVNNRLNHKQQPNGHVTTFLSRVHDSNKQNPQVPLTSDPGNDRENSGYHSPHSDQSIHRDELDSVDTDPAPPARTGEEGEATDPQGPQHTGSCNTGEPPVGPHPNHVRQPRLSSQSTTASQGNEMRGNGQQQWMRQSQEPEHGLPASELYAPRHSATSTSTPKHASPQTCTSSQTSSFSGGHQGQQRGHIPNGVHHSTSAAQSRPTSDFSAAVPQSRSQGSTPATKPLQKRAWCAAHEDALNWVAPHNSVDSQNRTASVASQRRSYKV